MRNGDRVTIIRGAYHGHEAEVVHKVCGQNDGWLCTSADFPGQIMVYASEIEAGDGEVTR